MSDDVSESFRSSLDDLKMNSKPQISMLTMLAEDHEQYASDIVRVIEEQIKKVPVSRKLPIMYLIDSIIKNLSGTMYPQLFAQCIVSVFCGVFEEVDEKTRQSMYKLRQTWPDIIPNKQLYILDRKVQLIDPAWPITAKAPEHSVIHVNPKFLKPKEKEERSPQFSPVHSDSSVDESIREELYAKEKELQKLRLELELAETKAKLEQQKKQLEQQALLKSNKNILDREPPPVIKLPPVGSSLATSGPPVNRDPRLRTDRDPRLNRDPRLKRQQEREEQERLELEKEKVEAAAVVAPTAGVRVPPIEPVPSVSTSPRMDLATLLNSFSNAAAKVAAEQARKRNPSVESISSKSSEGHSHGRSPEVHSHRSPESASHRKSPETFVHRRSPESVSQQTSQEIHHHARSEDVSQRKSPEINLQRKSPDEQINDNKYIFDKEEVLENKSDTQPNTESVANSTNAQFHKVHEPKNVSAKSKDKISEDKDSKRDKKWSPHGKDKEKQSNKDKEKRDSKDSNRKDSKEREKRDTKEKDRREKDLGRSRDRRDSRERRSEADINRHGERRQYRHSGPEFKRGSYRDMRDNRNRGRGRHGPPAIHSNDVRTDQFGRVLRSKSGSGSRDRSPVDRDERVARSPKDGNKEDKLRLERTPRENFSVVDASSHGETEGMGNTDLRDNGVYLLPPTESATKVEFVSEEEKIEDGRIENNSNLKEEVSSDTEFISSQMKVEPDDKSRQVCDVKNVEDLDMKPKQEVLDNVMSSSEDVDMRIQQQAVPVKKLDPAEAGRPDKAADESSGDSQATGLKRSYPDSLDLKPDLRPYKIPKLGAKKMEAKASDNQEDIRKLFGEQDVDYRHPMVAPVQSQPSVANQNYLPPSGLNVKSPAQRRWSQFKESHPDDFAQDMERKRLRDAQMQSMVTDIQDVDLRPLTSSRQRSLSIPDGDVNVPIPKDLSVENQEQILQRAEQELKEGRISHGDHQEIVRQLGQVYDIQKKRHNFEERSSRALDLRDPRLRGIRETKSPYHGDIDRRLQYPDDVEPRRKEPPRSHLPAQSSGDLSDQPSEHSPRYREKRENYRAGYEMSPNEDFDARQHIPSRPRHDRQIEYDRRRGIVDDFDGRSPKDMDSAQPRSVRDFDRAPLRYADYDGRHARDIERMSELSSHDIDARRSRRSEEDARSEYRSENLRGSFEYNRPHLRGPPMRGDMHPRELKDERLDDVHNVRRNTPPSDAPLNAPFRGPPTEDVEGHRPFGTSGPHVREPFINQRPRHGSVPDIRGPVPSFPNPMVRPEQRMPAPLGPRLQGPGPQGPPPQGPVHQVSAVSDPMDDPRWSAMKGLLDSEGTEELVIDGKPFELRMGTSRKLRIYGKVMDVAVDMKERGLRVDGQLVYKLGEPIKEVSAVGRTVRLYYHGLPKPIWLDGQQHEMRVDAPPRNVIVDGVRRGFQIDGRDMMILVDRLEKGPYGGPPRKIRIAGVDHDIAFQAPPRRILIDNKSCELKLDSKIPYIIIDGKPHGIRFDGEPRTVYINDQPFTVPVDRAEKIRIGPRPTYIAFGGPAHEIIIDGKWFEVKFDNIPKDIQLGNRHFSIRIPGPLPRVKILDELPRDFDDSRLMSSNQTCVPQPRTNMSGFSEPDMPVSMPFLQGHDGLQVPEGICTQAKPVPDSMHQQELSGPEGIRIPAAHVSDVIHPALQPGNDNNRPIITAASEGNLRPIGPLNSDPLRFSQPAAQMIPQPNQPMITQSGSAPSLIQPGTMHHGPNQMIGMARPNLIGFPGMTQSLQNPRMLQQSQPVNLLAQGLINQVASNMMSSTLHNMPDLAASIRALTQLNTAQQNVQPQIPTQTAIPPAQVHRHPLEDDHSAAMVTGMQGSLFIGQQPQKFQVNIPQKLSVPMHPVPTVAHPLPMSVSRPMPGPTRLPAPTVSHGLVRPMISTAPGFSTASSFGTAPGFSTAPSFGTAPGFIPGLSQPSTAETTPSAPANIDVNSLLNKLLQAGLIKEPPKSDTSAIDNLPAPQPETIPAVVMEKPIVPEPKQIFIPDLTNFDSDLLKQTHPAVIEQLHEGVQCHTCAARFTMGDHEKYRAHLDWHFRQNKLEQDMVKVAKNRKWFYSIPDWIQYEELEDTMDKTRSEIFEQMRTGEQPISSAAHALTVRALEGKEVVKNPVASGIEGEDLCATCGDPFDQMWNEETEEWILKNTIKVDGKTYHPVCYEDAQETPTPVTVPTKNPLELELQNLPKSEDSSSSLVKVEVKTEPMDITEELPVGNSEAAVVVVEVKPEPGVENTSKLISSSSSRVEQISSSRDSTDINSAINNTVSTDIRAAGSTVTPILPPSSATTTEVVSCQGPTLLSTIAKTMVREVIPVSHEDPMSPWEMDSNPTPELSRTPTPEPIQSFTPAQSLSSESISSLAQGSDSLASEEPLPPSLVSAAAASGVSKSSESSSVARN